MGLVATLAQETTFRHTESLAPSAWNLTSSRIMSATLVQQVKDQARTAVLANRAAAGQPRSLDSVIRVEPRLLAQTKLTATIALPGR